MNSAQKAKELQNTLNVQLQKAVQCYFDGHYTIQDLRITFMVIVDQFAIAENNAVNEID